MTIIIKLTYSALYLCPPDGIRARIATQRLLEKLNANKHHALVKEAESLGYIKSKRVRPEGKGNHKR